MSAEHRRVVSFTPRPLHPPLKTPEPIEYGVVCAPESILNGYGEEAGIRTPARTARSQVTISVIFEIFPIFKVGGRSALWHCCVNARGKISGVHWTGGWVGLRAHLRRWRKLGFPIGNRRRISGCCSQLSTYLFTYLLTYLLHGAQSFLRS